MRNKGMIFKALANAAAELHIEGEIGGWGIYASEIRRELKEMGKVDSLTIYLSSPGGSVIEGLNIYNLVKRLDCETTVVITGLAASMGSIIAMAADKTVMSEGTLMMIHNPWGGAFGEADEMRKVADILDKMKTSMIGIYESKSGLASDEISELMTAETWMDASEAKEKGFIDSIEGEIDAENVISIDDAKAAVEIATDDTDKELHKFAAMHSPLLEEFSGFYAVTDKSASPAPQNPKGTEDLASKIAKQIVEDLDLNHQGRNPEPQPKQEPNPMELTKEQKAALKARNEQVTSLFAKHTQLGELKSECLADTDLTIEQVKDKMLVALGANKENQPVGGVHVIADAKAKFMEGATKALSARAGLETPEQGNEFLGYSLTELARKSLELSGGKASGSKMDIIGNAFTHSTSDFGNLLSNVANKAMLKGFEESPETFDQFTGVGNLPDFKKSTRVDLGNAPSLREVKPGAEFKQITFTDSKAEAMLATYGELFGINRQTIINDDLDAFTRIPAKMGRAARRTVGDLVFAQLVAASHFSAANQLTSSALNSDNLDALRVKMITRKSSDEKSVTGVRPSFLLVPEALRGTAMQTIESEFAITAAETSRQPNKVRNMAQVISDYRLDADDPVRYYLLASAAMYDALEVLYLDGNSNPFLDQMTGWNIDGTQFKVRIDAAAKLWDNRSVARGKA